MDEPTPLSAAAEQHLLALPGLKYPLALVRQFPRIVNRLTELKDDPDALRHYFDELTHDARGGRRGFPFEVLMDLLALRERMLGDEPGLEVSDDTKWVS